MLPCSSCFTKSLRWTSKNTDIPWVCVRWKKFICAVVLYSWNGEMKHEFEASVLCNENEFPTYPRPLNNASKNTRQQQLNWSFLEPNTSANSNHVSDFYSSYILRLWNWAHFATNSSLSSLSSPLIGENCQWTFLITNEQTKFSIRGRWWNATLFSWNVWAMNGFIFHDRVIIDGNGTVCDRGDIQISQFN